MYFIVHYIVLYYTLLCYTTYYTILFCAKLYYVILYFIHYLLYCIALYYVKHIVLYDSLVLHNNILTSCYKFKFISQINCIS